MRHLWAKIATLLTASRHALSLGAGSLLYAIPAVHVQAAAPATLSSQIPVQPLATALETFSHQTGLHILYVSTVVGDQRSHEVAAGAAAPEALARLLQGTGLRFEFLTAHSVRIFAAPGSTTPSTVGADGSQPPNFEVVVTGSRIPVPADIAPASPIQVVTAQEILQTGHTDTADLLASLPQMITTSSADFGNHSNPNANAGGVTTADLRGLSPQRTVVLVNGRRLGVGDPNTGNLTPAPDLDQIPLALVERVEVLTGGASATYGADAVAGVVNFILKDHVQGIQIDAQYGLAQHTQHNDYLEGLESAAGFAPPHGTIVDGFRRDLSILAGSPFHDGDGEVTAYFIYHGQTPVRGADRDFSFCPAISNNILDNVPTEPGLACIGSTNGSNIFVPPGPLAAPYAVVGTKFVPWPARGSVPASFFNFSPYVYTQRSDKRYQAGVLGHLELNPGVRPYLELSYMDDLTRIGLAPSGLFIGENHHRTSDGGYLVNCSNPLLSAQQANLLCTPAQIAADRAHPGSVSADVLIGRRNIEGADRLTSFQHRNYRAVAGIAGDLGDDWSYNAYAVYYYTSLDQVYSGFLSTAAIDNALQVTTDPSGAATCISGGRCVPYNIFSSGAVTSRQLIDLYTIGRESGASSEQTFEADVTGQLARYGMVTPWAHEGASINAGIERRTDGLRFRPDAAELSGDLSGLDAAFVPLDKRISVNEGFIEVRAPIVQNQSLARDLTLAAGYRYSAYSSGNATNTYRFEAQFAPVYDLRLRATYDRVIRAPSLIELYTPLSYGSSSLVGNDPCAPTNGGATHAAATLTQCMRTGVTAAQYGDGFGPAFGGTSTIPPCSLLSCGVVAGGNPALAPEIADTWSAGITLTPTAFPSLSATLDYFHILLKGEIGAIPDSVTLNRCLAIGDPTACSQIVRSPAGALGGSLAGGGYILANELNIGTALVSGVDVQANLQRLWSGRAGTLSVNLSGSWIQHNASRPYRNAPSFDCAGLFGNTCLNGSVNPKWRHNLRLSWDTPWDAQLSVQWRFIGRAGFDNNSAQALLQNQEEGFFDPVLTHVPSVSYLDLAGIWNLTRHVQVRLTVSNLLDKDPPFVPYEISVSSGGFNTFPVYDILGRNFSLAMRVTL